MEVLSLDEYFGIESTLYTDESTVEDLKKIIEAKKGIPSIYINLYTGGRRLDSRLRVKNLQIADSLQLILSEDIDIWRTQYLIRDTDIRGTIDIAYPQNKRLIDIVEKIIPQIPSSDQIRQIKLYHSEGKISGNSQLQTVLQNSPLEIAIKEENNQSESAYITVNVQIETSNQCIPLKIKRSSKIYKIMWLLACKLYKVQILFHKNVILDNENTVGDCAIQDNDTITGSNQIDGGGGGDVSFMYVDFSNYDSITFDRSAPNWRIAKPGISWKAICRKKGCCAKGQFVIVNKGFGVYNLGEILYKLECPMCKSTISDDDVSNCGFVDCKWKIKGMKDSKELYEEIGDVGTEFYHTFQGERTARWKWLKIEARERIIPYIL